MKTLQQMKRQYRYVGKNGYATRWRDMPEDGLEPPSKTAKRKLGEGYGLQIREPAPVNLLQAG
jgi:hypothetical protein